MTLRRARPPGSLDAMDGLWTGWAPECSTTYGGASGTQCDNQETATVANVMPYALLISDSIPLGFCEPLLPKIQ